ncbi:MAG: LCP family protein [Clostridia bacterium]|nr:LCP family protein [Clostridia bacterium]MBR4442048.1 LCP family protein [Clostridia bacterium]
MKRVLVAAVMLFALLTPLLALAESAPANPMAPRPTVNSITLAPTAEPTPSPTPAPTPEPTLDPEAVAMPARPEDDFRYDSGDMLDEDMIARLDEEVRDYLIGTGELIDTVDGVRNILLVGLDARPGETQSRSDAMVILTIDGNANQIRLTSLLRDMYVSIPDYGNNRINTAWVFGGFELLRAAILENFGLQIDEYVAVDMTLLAELIDRIGGLTLTVRSEKELRAINGVIDGYNYQFHLKANSDFLTKVGEQHMNGKQVQAYARYRRIDSDFKRTERQREVLGKIFERLQEMSLIELSRLASYAVDRVETNISLSGVISLIPVMFNMKDAGFGQLTLPYEGEYQSKTISGMSVLVPDLRAAQTRLRAFING